MTATPPRPATVRETVSGWARHPAAETTLYRPERRELLTALVHRSNGPLIARGLGASYGDASFTSAGATVLTTRLNRLLHFDPATAILTCEPGVTIQDLLLVFAPRGYFPPVCPGTQRVTLGGCVACDVHGKNHHRSGSLADHLVDFHLLLADGTEACCSRTQRPDLFWATIGGMGLTGIITELRLRLAPIESPFLRVTYDRADHLEALLQGFEEDAQYAYSVAWLDGLARGGSLGRGVLMRANPLTAESEVAEGTLAAPTAAPRSMTVPAWLPGGLLNATTVGAFNAMYFRRFPRRQRERIVHHQPFFFPLDRLQQWHRLYGKRGFYQYQCVVPFSGGAELLTRLLELVSRRRMASFLAVLKRFGPADPAQMLSFPRPGYTLALDIPRGDPQVPASLAEMDRLVAGAGGRVYLAKDARLDPEAFRAMYPEAPAWTEIKQLADPSNRFRSDLGDRLGLTA